MGGSQQERRGVLLVFASALTWSFGGPIARFLSINDSWTVVFWRSLFAACFLFGFMLWSQGRQGARQQLLAMGWPGIGVGLCFATASTSFVVAMSYTTIANILLMQAGVPLIAALMSYLLFRERVALGTWLAIAAVIAGVAVMVSESIQGRVSPVGDGLSLLIALAFASATVITRRHANVGMTPAVCLGTVVATCVAAPLAGSFAISLSDAGLLFVFGAFNLGLGMAFFVTGVRLLPSALAALIGIAEPVLGPLWVWLVHDEVPGERTLLGGAMVFLALLAHLSWQFRQQRPIQQMPPAEQDRMP